MSINVDNMENARKANKKKEELKKSKKLTSVQQMIKDLKKMLEKNSSLVKPKFLIVKLNLCLGHNPFQNIVRKNNKCDHLSAYRPWRRVPCPWPQAGGRLLLLLAPLPSHPPSHPAG